ncbi:MAG TPA: PIG-L family deacetylase [Pyrinomonadaceae bacterium]|nr:PIG-L family deacetylase [Pyrinomonadaceae bacterium]
MAGSSRAREAAQARPEPDREDEPREIAIYQALLDLTTPWTVMCVAAHPDDEDGATLTVLRRKGGVHTVTLFSTYGEGGQNAIGPELYEELGAIRARETIEAARVQGSEPHFLGLRDFGFSKSADEALRVWGHDTALARMVLEIRRLRPDVIITNHDTVTGHGHHQATGRLVLEAFDAAADPSRFPEQLREAGVTTWQPQRLFVRFGFEGGPETRALEEEAVRQGQVISITPNERDPVRGLTYAEQALSALRRHASQGPWPSTVPAGWTRAIRYRLARAAKSSAPLPRDAPSFLTGLSLPGNSADQLMPLAARAMLPVYLSNGRKAEGVRDALVAARKAGLFAPSGGDVDDLPRFRLMSDRLDRALALASGIRVRIATREDVLVTDATTPFSLSISNEGERAARITEIDFKDLRSESGIDVPHNLAPGATLNLTASAYAPRSAALSVPHAAHLYDGLLFGVELGARALVELDGARFPVSATTRMDIAPAVEIANLSPNPYVQTPATINRGLTFKLRLVNHRRAQFDGSVGVASPDSSRMPAFRTEVSLGPNETRDLVLRSNPVSARRAPGRRRALLAGGGGDEPGTVEVSLYSEHDPKSPIARQSAQLVYSEARVAPSLRVGFVPSFDETLKNALAALGVQSRELTVDDVRAGRLGRYDAIIIDNRGYQSHPELVAANARLLDYVRAGGNLVVFYHKTNEWNPSPKVNRPQLAPYALVLGNSRVTDENAPVTFSEPAHALLRWPNPISADDFKGWIQERGLYYPQEWDAAHYSAPLSMSDAGEPPLRGGLLAADYGRGRYIYTGIVWYRQLRAGVPGAYRMFANIISYGRAPRETKRARERAAADAAALDAWPLSK